MGLRHVPLALLRPCSSRPNQAEKGQGMTITVYSKPSCVQCTATYRALDSKGVAYQIIDLSEDDAALTRVTELGYRQVPVVIAGGDHWAGFRPDKISALC